MPSEYDVNRMTSSPITNLLIWLTEENIITESQAEAIARPLFLTLHNHYVKKNDIEGLSKRLEAIEKLLESK